jgi:probable rRNA maturation factor
MIEINNLTTIRVKEGFLKRVAEKVLKGENKSGTGLSVALVNEERMRELNKKYRRKNRVTDVLSFSYNDSGEIVICPREVKKNVKKINSTFEKELARTLIHGILHLLGENHETSKLKAKKMEEKQEDYLKLFFR